MRGNTRGPGKDHAQSVASLQSEIQSLKTRLKESSQMNREEMREMILEFERVDLALEDKVLEIN